jgi:heat shock protein HtpX
MSPRTAAPLNDSERRRHKLRNVAQSALLLCGLLGLLVACMWLLFGEDGALWGLVGWGAALLLGPRISPRLVLGLYRAERLGSQDFPDGFAVLRWLGQRAGLDHIPSLYYVPSATVNAFTLGSRHDAAIAITDGMLRTLTLRELTGVLAHELSHIRNNDLWIMNLADSISRLTSMMAFIGMLLVFVSLPMMLVGAAPIPLILAILLIFAPTVSSLLQLALARAREYDADLDAAGLTGDPVGLASALEKLERLRVGGWERVMFPGRRMPDPSLLRTHPSTDERIRRLLALQPVPSGPPAAERVRFVRHMPVIEAPPRWRPSGLWY